MRTAVALLLLLLIACHRQAEDPMFQIPEWSNYPSNDEIARAIAGARQGTPANDAAQDLLVPLLQRRAPPPDVHALRIELESMRTDFSYGSEPDPVRHLTRFG